jgi:anti-anti-sigma factor
VVQGKTMAVKRRSQLEIQRENGKVVIHLKGNLDGSSVCQVDHAMKRLEKTPEGCQLVFDLGGVRNFEYFGIVLLAKSLRSQKNRFQEISLTGLRRSTESIFKRFGLENGKVTRFQS